MKTRKDIPVPGNREYITARMILWTKLCPTLPNLSIEVLNPNVIIFGDEIFGN